MLPVTQEPLINVRAERMNKTRMAWLVVVALVVFGSLVRIQLPLSKSYLDWEHPEGMLRSDPGLVYYITEGIAGANGGLPDDFRSDPRIEYPELCDIPAMFTVGQEFIAAWSWLLFGGDMPLHKWCVIIMGIMASLTAVGIFGAALELTGKPWLAALAALLYGFSVANYRTIGFILIREDLSLPLFALHLWLLARAVRLKTWPAFMLSGIAVSAALATWHAMGFVIAAEAACVLLWSLRSGTSPFKVQGAWALPAVVAIASLVIPVLQAKLFLLSLPMAMSAALLLMALLESKMALKRSAYILIAMGILLTLALLSMGITYMLTGQTGDYAHVFDLMWSKAVHFGQLPADPQELSFGARLLWQGPFDTGSVLLSLMKLPLASLLLVAAVFLAAITWYRNKGEGVFAVSVAYAAVMWILGILVVRLVAVAGITAPIAAALFLSRVKIKKMAIPVIILAGLQLFIFVGFIDKWISDWHEPGYRIEMGELADWMRTNIDDKEAVACDFVTATEILVHTSHPVILQPKYETRRSRDRIEEFIVSLYTKSPEEFRRLLVDKYKCKYLLVYARQLWTWRYKAGIPMSMSRPPKGTAAEALIKFSPQDLVNAPGYELLYKSPFPSDYMRLYRID